MASHGSDQLIVQRILATRTLRDSQKAIIGSGIFVTIQFAAFSLVGALLWSYRQGLPTGKGRANRRPPACEP